MASTFSDPLPISLNLLRGRPSTLLGACPRFKDSHTPVVFHLPVNTAMRALASVSSDTAADIYIFNGLCEFGEDYNQMNTMLPRWRFFPNKERSIELAYFLSTILLSKWPKIEPYQLISVIEVTSNLTVSGILPQFRAKEILSRLIPRCLDELQLSKKDVDKLLLSVNHIDEDLRVKLIDFSRWFAHRREINARKRNIQLTQNMLVNS